MSRISGHKYIKTNCCGEQYRYLHFSSISFQQDVYWTDGGGLRNSSLSSYSVKICKCGEVFKISEQIRLPIEMCDVKNENTPINASLEDMVKFLVKNDEIESDLIELVRRTVWRLQNDEFRNVYLDKSFRPTVQFKTNEESIRNMKKLIEILSKSEFVNHFEIAELYRELADFDKAKIEALKIGDDDETLRKVQLDLIEKKIQEPTIYTP